MQLHDIVHGMSNLMTFYSHSALNNLDIYTPLVSHLGLFNRFPITLSKWFFEKSSVNVRKYLAPQCDKVCMVQKYHYWQVPIIVGFFRHHLLWKELDDAS